MKIRIELPAAVWPESREAAPVQAGLALPALAWLLGRASLTAATCQDKIERAPLLLADLMPQSEPGYWLCADPSACGSTTTACPCSMPTILRSA
jgi:hypothetical protein